MLIIICDECGKRQANTLQVMNGWVEYEGVKYEGKVNDSLVTLTFKSATVDLCKNHWPEKGATQPKNCKLVKFVWPEDGPPDPPFTGPIPPVTHHSSLFPITFSGPHVEDGYDDPIFKQVES